MTIVFTVLLDEIVFKNFFLIIVSVVIGKINPGKKN